MLLLHELFSKYDALLEDYHVYKVETIGESAAVQGAAVQGGGHRRAAAAAFWAPAELLHGAPAA